MKYLFNAWNSVKKKINKNNLFIFLDFDGTLTPIVSTPQKAVLSKAVRKLLKEMSKNHKIRLVFISGRSLKDIKRLIGIKGVIYVGNHGLEIDGPKTKFKSPVSLAHKKILKCIKDDLKTRLSAVGGLFIEDKGLSLSVHYRLVDKYKIPEIKTVLHNSITPYFKRGIINIKSGKKVFEIRPLINWDKGKAVLWLLPKKDIIPIYLGDDTTDEDAFKVLKNRGITIFVGRPKKSYAEYFLKDTKEVEYFLNRLYYGKDYSSKRTI